MFDTSENNIIIRDARKEDMRAVAKMIQEHANLQLMQNEPKLTVKELEYDGFERQPPAFRCKIAEDQADSVNSQVGYALYFPTYSAWYGASMMLQDLYAQPEVQRYDVRERLFDAVAKEAVTSGSSCLDFHLLAWDRSNIIYQGKGAQNITKSEQWCFYRLSGQELRKAAQSVTENP
ncbi:thialysine N-epsilon-acetyltransferase-like [Galleria mellonella]|uniref:Thialysine N-epsilon-acetyltransferase-like n=1 Tax=Galleria mellonella TaxID=7137 RepID=A0A6J1WX94_GALME|nr:thialysine N-epsilon-acetyltransferase-like [Galleria mellonella]